MQLVLDIQNISLFTAAIINSILLVLVYFRNRKSALNKWFALFATSLVFWCMSMFVYRSAITEADAMFWVVPLYTVALFITPTFLNFAFALPMGKINVNKIYRTLLWVPTFLLILLVIKPGAVVKSVEIVPGQEKNIIWGPYYFLYTLFFLASFSAVFFILFKKFIKNTGIIKTQIKFILLGTFVPAIIANITNLTLPGYGIFSFNWVGQLMTIPMVVFIVYAIIKHHLLNIKLIATEIFSILLVLVIFIETITSESGGQFLFSFGVFLAVFLSSFLIIKSTLKEIRDKERIAKISDDLRKANEELKKLDQTKSDFLSIAAHQLRTPVTALKGYSSMILEGDFGKVPKLIAGAVDKIYQSSQRLVFMVNDFLDVSRIETGRMTYTFDEFDLDDLIISIVNDISINNKKAKDLKLGFFTNVNNLKINGDIVKIRQAISNLVDNALKYTKKGHVKVFLDKEPDKNTALVKVEDSGIGISKEMLPRLFQKFSRSNNVSLVHTDGSGLGLYVAKRIIEHHHGKIWVESKGIGRGSTFYIELPLA